MEKLRLPIARIAPGMKLAEPITNAGGVTLMPAGIRLTPMFIARIRKWNITALDVFVESKRAGGPPPPSANPLPPPPVDDENSIAREQEEFARSVAQEISRPFINVRDNPLMMQLRAVVIRSIVAQGQRGLFNLLRQSTATKGEND